MYVVLSTPKVRSLLEDCEVPSVPLLATLERELPRDCPPEFEYRGRGEDGHEITRYGRVDRIEGQAIVLAATPDQHIVDDVDVFVSSLFDPTSLLSRSVSLDTTVDRAFLLNEISRRLGRYRGVAFPASKVVTLVPPVRLPWEQRKAVLARLSQAIPEGVYWTYIRRGDELVLFAEDTVHLGDLV